MAANEFQLKIIGADVTPATVDIGDLAEVLAAVRGAVVAIAENAGKDESEVELGLVGIAEGSNLLTLVGSPVSLRSTQELTTALASGTVDTLPKKSHPHLRKLWKLTFDNGWDECCFEGNGSHIGSGAIQSSVELFPDKTQYRGCTTLYGECLKAGGETKRSALLRLLDGSRITVRLKTKELAQALGQRLYQTVGLSGEGFWTVSENKLVAFRADSLASYTDRDCKDNQRTVLQALSALARAAGNRWENVDPDEFVHEQRREQAW